MDQALLGEFESPPDVGPWIWFYNFTPVKNRVWFLVSTGTKSLQLFKDIQSQKQGTCTTLIVVSIVIILAFFMPFLYKPI